MTVVLLGRKLLEFGIHWFLEAPSAALEFASASLQMMTDMEVTLFVPMKAYQ